MTTSRDIMQEVAPKLAELTGDLLFGDIWERPQLSKRDRSLIIVAVLTALYRTDQLRGHIGRALDNGVTREELGEVFGVSRERIRQIEGKALNKITKTVHAVAERRGLLGESGWESAAKKAAA